MSLASGPGLGGSSPDMLWADKHVEYIVSLDKRDDEYEYWLTEHLRLNGVFWGLHALHILGHPTALPRDDLIRFTMSCWDASSGGFGAAPDHDPHMLYTCSAVQILVMVDGVSVLDEPAEPGSSETKRMRVAHFISSLQDRETGTFHGDKYGEPDTRFLYNALNSLSLLGKLNLVDVPLAVKYIDSCSNADGGYGTVPGAESHSGQIFVCLAALSIAGVLDQRLKDDSKWADRLGGWLSERQISTGKGYGGLNGRPEKEEDVCYAWWVGTSLVMLQRSHWIDRPALRKFILSCQDGEHGGISDRPGHAVDVFHTHFGIVGLSLLEWSENKDGEASEPLGLEEVDPVYCMPRSITKALSRTG
ncbi:type II protein geranylgeranyltransferase beta subunit [Microthyrium microscopicum]|uniref:Geranylgeranyl transferase type-2 subunit beta n=1 Tax=Microthyrium microscopicum TaxID=703497 RepID=A0A6A6UBS2_9PEZI|nr:type II protein geranylgeranyltransferase beta subunit [Microthyrium microscopicum]